MTLITYSYVSIYTLRKKWTKEEDEVNKIVALAFTAFIAYAYFCGFLSWFDALVCGYHFSDHETIYKYIFLGAMLPIGYLHYRYLYRNKDFQKMKKQVNQCRNKALWNIGVIIYIITAVSFAFFSFYLQAERIIPTLFTD